MADFSLLLNGVYESVLDEASKACIASDDGVAFLQPYHPKRIARLYRHRPSHSRPIALLITLTTDLSKVHFVGEVVEIFDKRDPAPQPGSKNIVVSPGGSAEWDRINAKILRHQPREGGLYWGSREGHPSRNALGVRRLHRLTTPIPVATFQKLSGGGVSPDRTRSGGWAYVFPMDTSPFATSGTSAS